MLKPFLAAVLDFIFPPLCHVCRSYIPAAGDVHICSRCRQKMSPITSPLCSLCGTPFSGAGDDHICGPCWKVPPHFEAARAAYVYDGPCRDLIHSFKYHNKTHLRRPLALLTIDSLSDFITSQAPDLIMPVPLHRARLRSRGFNQAILLGEVISRRSRIPLDRDNLKRVRWTEPQVSLSADERRTNVKGAFSVKDPSRVNGCSILLVDDVLTTGSTVDECSRILKSAGASTVSVVTVARALSP
jgi:ComF family protein